MKFLKLLVVLAICGSCLAAEGDEVVLRGVGATFPDPMYQHWIELYHQSTGQRVIYQPVGSSEGINQLTKKQVDFGGTDAFTSDSITENPGEKPLHLPTCLGAVVITYNLSSNPSLQLDAEVVSDIFLGKITNWSDRAIKKLNPNTSLPDLPITVVHRADGSGTTFIFTSYLAKMETEWASKVGAAKAVTWPTGIGLDGNSKVADFAKKIEGSIAYMEWTFAVKNNLQFAKIKNKTGKFITPSVESISQSAMIELPVNLKVLLIDTVAPGGYPICGFTYLIFYAEQGYGGRSKAQAEALGKWLWWTINEGQTKIRDMNYAPLPNEATVHARNILNQRLFMAFPS